MNKIGLRVKQRANSDSDYLPKNNLKINFFLMNLLSKQML